MPAGPTGQYRAPRQLADHALTQDGQRVALSTLTGQAVDAVAGLARPEAFFTMLRQSGLTLAHTHALPDHHDFQDWQPTPTGRPMLCTEKDAAKLWPHQPDALAVPLVVTPEPAFWTALDTRIRQLLPR
jgi:tetraacyldisaccharide 4'-kinase